VGGVVNPNANFGTDASASADAVPVTNERRVNETEVIVAPFGLSRKTQPPTSTAGQLHQATNSETGLSGIMDYFTKGSICSSVDVRHSCALANMEVSSTGTFAARNETISAIDERLIVTRINRTRGK
jgi:hypothetical protein